MKFKYKDAVVTITEETIIIENSNNTYVLYEEKFMEYIEMVYNAQIRGL